MELSQCKNFNGLIKTGRWKGGNASTLFKNSDKVLTPAHRSLNKSALSIDCQNNEWKSIVSGEISVKGNNICKPHLFYRDDSTSVDHLKSKNLLMRRITKDTRYLDKQVIINELKKRMQTNYKAIPEFKKGKWKRPTTQMDSSAHFKSDFFNNKRYSNLEKSGNNSFLGLQQRKAKRLSTVELPM